jgi:hypothetical protein
MSILKKLVVVLLAFALAACAHYYKVTDPASGKVYYTEKVKRDGSAVQFKDSQTGSETTLQSSEVAEVSKQTYQQAVGSTKK